ncbi:MAG: anti-sigma factor family protein, partial [Planctomycetota bacterium]
MNDDWNDRLDEYLEGVLPAEEARQVEEALARDPMLRAEFDRVRRFAELMEEQTPDAHAVKRVMSRLRARQRRWLFLAAPLAAAAAALLIWLAWPPSPPPTHVNQVLNDLEARWLSFGERLGEIALERREGRVPR